MLYAQGCNILETDQYSCPYKGLFFQRIRFDYSDCYLGNTEVAIAGLEAAIESVASRFHMKWSMRCGDKPKRMAILVSKFDHCLLRHSAEEEEQRAEMRDTSDHKQPRDTQARGRAVWHSILPLANRVNEGGCYDGPEDEGQAE